MKNDAGKEFGGFEGKFKDVAAEIGETMRSRAVEEVCHQWEDNLIFNSTWRGVVCAKNPCDAWVYQELIGKLKPDLIIETGSFKGGSALMLMDFMEIAGVSNGEILSVDVTNYTKPKHDRIHWITGSSIAADIVSHIRSKARGRNVLVILDSDHSYGHVLEELRLYGDLVPKGGYCIVEDTWVNAHNGGGPWPAVEEYMNDKPGMYEIDRTGERYLMTNNPKGFLRRL